MQPVSTSLFRHALIRFGLPILLAVGLPVVLEHAPPIAASYELVLHRLPYILLPVVLILGPIFNQSRISIAALLLLISYYIIQTRLQSPLSIESTKLVFTLLALLLPLHLLLLHHLPERRILTRSNIIFIVFIVFEVIGGSLLVQSLSTIDLEPLWNDYLISFPLISQLPVAIILVFVGSATIHSILVLKRNQTHDQALFICTLFTGITFVFFHFPLISSTAYTFTSLLLLINLINCSHELAYIDQLTGIPGRRSLDTELKHLGRIYSIAMLDIDHFKVFNDTYGHNTGDDVLRLVASIIVKQPGGAKVYRYGGEEFTLIFKGRYQDECLKSLEHLRKQIASYPLVIQSHQHRQPTEDKQPLSANITVSIGIADNTQTASPHAVLKAADKALYKAKSNGRNCVCRRL